MAPNRCTTENAGVQEPHFRADLYEGTAADYEHFRPTHPPALMRDLLRRAQVGAGGRLLDLACGTGQIAFALRTEFENVWAVDQEPGLVDLARAKAERLHVSNVRWIAQRAEDLDVGTGRFDLVAIGNAFHRLRRRDVAGRVYRWLEPGGCIALLWGDAPWVGHAPWQRAMDDLVQRWIARAGAEDRIPTQLDEAIENAPHDEVLRDAGFEVVGKFEFLTPHVWTIEALVGFAYSTSVLSREVLGARTPEFANDLRGELLALEPSSWFEQDLSSAYELARRPAMT